jgi:hypothetical protein
VWIGWALEKLGSMGSLGSYGQKCDFSGLLLTICWRYSGTMHRLGFCLAQNTFLLRRGLLAFFLLEGILPLWPPLWVSNLWTKCCQPRRGWAGMRAVWVVSGVRWRFASMFCCLFCLLFGEYGKFWGGFVFKGGNLELHMRIVCKRCRGIWNICRCWV